MLLRDLLATHLLLFLLLFISLSEIRFPLSFVVVPPPHPSSDFCL